MPDPRLLLTGALAASVLMACSTVSSILPRGPEPVCGASIERMSVLVLDMTAYRLDQQRIEAAIEERVGEYRILTDEPVWIPKRTVEGQGGHTGSIATVQSIAAEWGCNLLVLLDTRMERTGVMTQARNEGRVWLVHAGRRGEAR